MSREVLTPALVIRKKRDGKELTSSEIEFFIAGLGNGTVADYQATAFLMAVFLKGFSPAETQALTIAMRNSGDRYLLKSVKTPLIDKHSTGGVGDKVSLILAPLVASCGVAVPMMSGRGLGHSGGTLDKLESIPGFDINLSEKRFEELLCTIGCAMIGQSGSIVPADRKLYALRDVTSTVESIPLIVGSILSKKSAEGARGLVLDVKFGSGAFFKTATEAKELARYLLSVSKKLNLESRALITDMSRPLGYAVGNLLEVIECVEILTGQSDERSKHLIELTLELSSHMISMGLKITLAKARLKARDALESGAAYAKWIELCEAQKALPQAAENPWEVLERAIRRGKIKKEALTFKRSMKTIDCRQVGECLIDLGGGRKRAGDPIDPLVGFRFSEKSVEIFYNPKTCNKQLLKNVKLKLTSAISLGIPKKQKPHLVHEVLS